MVDGFGDEFAEEIDLEVAVSEGGEVVLGGGYFCCVFHFIF